MMDVTPAMNHDEDIDGDMQIISNYMLYPTCLVYYKKMVLVYVFPKKNHENIVFPIREDAAFYKKAPFNVHHSQNNLIQDRKIKQKQPHKMF